jgi:hypothetical protein
MEDPTEYMHYVSDGTIDVTNPRVKYTVDLLKLNSPKLVSQRRLVFKYTLDSGDNMIEVLSASRPWYTISNGSTLPDCPHGSLE